MTRVFENKSDLLGAVGETLGSSEWVEVTREMVHQFADATGDHQWIHVDDERARRESPFGGPIAHGYLTLSLLPLLSKSVYRIDGAKMVVNYGSDKVRFPSPVPVGAKVRNTAVPLRNRRIAERFTTESDHQHRRDRRRGQTRRRCADRRANLVLKSCKKKADST